MNLENINNLWDLKYKIEEDFKECYLNDILTSEEEDKEEMLDSAIDSITESYTIYHTDIMQVLNVLVWVGYILLDEENSEPLQNRIIWGLYEIVNEIVIEKYNEN